MFSLLFGFAFGVVVGSLLLGFSVIEKLKTHDCTYVSGAVKWVERSPAVPALVCLDCGHSAEIKQVAGCLDHPVIK